MKRILVIFSLIFLFSCSNNQNTKKEKIESAVCNISQLSSDKDIENYLIPFRKSLEEKTSQKIADLNIDLLRGQPNSPLGLFSAEVIRAKGKEYSKLDVDFAVLNNGGLRKELAKGKLTLGDIYELMPFDNYIVILSLTGKEVIDLCKEVIDQKGMPLSGLQININSKKEFVNCFVNNQEIIPDKKYLISTINYLYQVGDGLPTLTKAKVELMMYQRLFRDAIIEYVTEKKVIDNVIENQIKEVE